MTIFRRKAEWIYYRERGFKQCKCSNCKTSYGCIDTPYCPNCGRKMVESKKYKNIWQLANKIMWNKKENKYMKVLMNKVAVLSDDQYKTRLNIHKITEMFFML